jgi:hypothetical protein
MEEVAYASNARPVVLVLQADNMGAAMQRGPAHKCSMDVPYETSTFVSSVAKAALQSQKGD